MGASWLVTIYFLGHFFGNLAAFLFGYLFGHIFAFILGNMVAFCFRNIFTFFLLGHVRTWIWAYTHMRGTPDGRISCIQYRTFAHTWFHISLHVRFDNGMNLNGDYWYSRFWLSRCVPDRSQGLEVGSNSRNPSKPAWILTDAFPSCFRTIHVHLPSFWFAGDKR